MTRTLLAITTANQSAFTKTAVASLASCGLKDLDLLVVDDASNDDTIEFLRKSRISFVTKPSAKGLTDSWNIAYRRFKAGTYDYFLLANNDILVPRGAIGNLCAALQSCEAAGPLTTEQGCGYQMAQNLRRYRLIDVDASDPKNFEDVQEILNRLGGPATKKVPALSGFFMGFNRNIIRYELPDGSLFDPRNVNVGNEDELCRRIQGDKVVCLNSFVFHFKGASFRGHEIGGGLMVDRELTWEQSARIQSPLSRVLRLDKTLILPRLISAIKRFLRG